MLLALIEVTVHDVLLMKYFTSAATTLVGNRPCWLLLVAAPSNAGLHSSWSRPACRLPKFLMLIFARHDHSSSQSCSPLLLFGAQPQKTLPLKWNRNPFNPICLLHVARFIKLIRDAMPVPLHSFFVSLHRHLFSKAERSCWFATQVANFCVGLDFSALLGVIDDASSFNLGWDRHKIHQELLVRLDIDTRL